MRPLLLLALAGALTAAVAVKPGSDPSKHVLKGKLVTPDEVLDGELVIQGNTITCVAADCDDPAGASLITITNAYVFPGFLDAHNHVAYNFLPKWIPPKLYKNRSQWQAAQSYKEFKKPYNELKDNKGLFCEMLKYGEIKALISGVTTIQGTSPGSACVKTLIRNAENQNELGLDARHVRTYILDIGNFDGSIDPAVTKSFVVHIAEGIDEKSRKEFDTLKQKGLLTAQTAIIHGTALGAAEFQQMAKAGAKLIWSPQSNLALYGQTTNIKLALEHGVAVSLGVDWNPSGSNHIFDELRVAAEVDQEEFGGVLKGLDLVKMITSNPARALGLEAHLGRLAAGLKADITVVGLKDADPGQSLLKSHLNDVQMVWLGGELLYGDAAAVQRIKPDQCEPLAVLGAKKRICVKDSKDPVEKSNQTLAEIQSLLLTNYPGVAPLVQ